MASSLPANRTPGISHQQFSRRPHSASFSSSPSATTTMHARIEIATKLFDFASEETSIDHPLCQDCSDLLCGELDRQVQEASMLKETYNKALSALKAQAADPSNVEHVLLSDEEFEEELRKALKEENDLKAQVAEAEAERSQVQKEIQTLQGELAQLDTEEERYWTEVNGLQWNVRCHLEERDWLERSMTRATEQLDRLKRTNVYNDLFFIWHDGHFGTINGLRLGRLPTIPVDWSEINAAWGHATLLLQVLGKRCQFQFHPYRPVPCGSHSKMVDTKNKSYDLFYTEDVSLRKFIGGYSAYNEAMTCFLKALKQLAEYAQAHDRRLKLPYTVEEDKINGHSIRLSAREEESWSKALKYMLTHLKWLISFVAKLP
eukprot:CAMPEP_0184671314 /NCGR_PEP_ID=MMETSP0308-20130426/85423_1 /TAXON_ID=38269 /ORGANISM="Gloeochaete witrockiana, Strain SAG 46.84" /LENGTH=374 /DNA_ID=CAMNT_0027118411 /DNA_START=353 /DNA_END=1477 /DNA_ORIENTATION=+